MGYNNFPRGLSSFYIKLYQVVDDPSSDAIISWSEESNNSFIIRNVGEFCTTILPKYREFGFNFSRFFSKLRPHGFQRVRGRPGLMEFGHEDFVRDSPERLKNMAVESLSAKRRAKRAAKAKAKKARVQVECLLQHLRI